MIEDYFEIREIPNRGVCGLERMIYTVGLFYNMNAFFYEGRYCYPTLADAKEAIRNWNGEGDPSGNWIKHKGRIEYSNPNIEANK
jgi:hypothetical protein